MRFPSIQLILLRHHNPRKLALTLNSCTLGGIVQCQVCNVGSSNAFWRQLITLGEKKEVVIAWKF